MSLELAYLHRERVNKILAKKLLEDRYKYYSYGSYADFTIAEDTTSWSQLSLVSIKDEKILGMLTAYISRDFEKVHQLSIINFGEINYTFSRDLVTFLDDLFTKYNHRKIEFSVAVGNPSETMYDKYIAKYGGRIIGYKEKCIKLQDNLFYDVKYYELFRSNYLRAKNGICQKCNYSLTNRVVCTKCGTLI